MSKVRRIDFYPDDFLVGTSGMNPTEGWVYWIACVLMYSRGGPIQIDDLRRWLRLRGVHFQQAFDALVEAGKLTLDGSSIRSQRVLNELSRASQRVLKLSSNGSQGGRPPRDANGLAKPNGSLAREQPTTNNQQEGSLRSPTRARRDPAGFEAFWQHWPHKVERRAAVKAFPQAVAAAGSVETILDGVERYIAAKPPDRAFCNPATFLNGQRWLDQPAANDGKTIGGHHGSASPHDLLWRAAHRVSQQ